MDNCSLAPQWKSFGSGTAAPRSRPRAGASLSIHPTTNDMWSADRPNPNGLGREFALNLSRDPGPSFPAEQPGWGSHSSRKRDSRQWAGSANVKGGGRNHTRSEHGGHSSDRDLARSKSKPEPFKSHKPRFGKPSRQDPKLGAHSILGAALKAVPPPQAPLAGPSVTPETAQLSWATGSVKARKREPKPEEETPEDRVKESKAKGNSERILFRRVFDSLHQYRLDEGDKEEVAKQAFHAALFRKVFDRLRGGVCKQQDQEEAFLRTLGWAPEGEGEELDDAPLTAEEIAAFQTVHKARVPSGSTGIVATESDASSTCTSDSDSDDIIR